VISQCGYVLGFHGYVAASSQARRRTLISSGIGLSRWMPQIWRDEDAAELGGHVDGRWLGLAGVSGRADPVTCHVGGVVVGRAVSVASDRSEPEA
jgi:hypothetical protein